MRQARLDRLIFFSSYRIAKLVISDNLQADKMVTATGPLTTKVASGTPYQLENNQVHPGNSVPQKNCSLIASIFR
jgi:hypothetical protein